MDSPIFIICMSPFLVFGISGECVHFCHSLQIISLKRTVLTLNRRRKMHSLHMSPKRVSDVIRYKDIGWHYPVMQQSSDTHISSKEILHLT